MGQANQSPNARRRPRSIDRDGAAAGIKSKGKGKRKGLNGPLGPRFNQRASRAYGMTRHVWGERRGLADRDSLAAMGRASSADSGANGPPGFDRSLSLGLPASPPSPSIGFDLDVDGTDAPAHHTHTHPTLHPHITAGRSSEPGGLSGLARRRGDDRSIHPSGHPSIISIHPNSIEVRVCVGIQAHTHARARPRLILGNREAATQHTQYANRGPNGSPPRFYFEQIEWAGRHV